MWWRCHRFPLSRFSCPDAIIAFTKKKKSFAKNSFTLWITPNAPFHRSECSWRSSSQFVPHGLTLDDHKARLFKRIWRQKQRKKKFPLILITIGFALHSSSSERLPVSPFYISTGNNFTCADGISTARNVDSLLGIEIFICITPILHPSNEMIWICLNVSRIGICCIVGGVCITHLDILLSKMCYSFPLPPTLCLIDKLHFSHQ